MMSSTRPYLTRCFYNWIIDNKCTPYVVINTDIAKVDVPEEYIEGDQIVLNISPEAVRDLKIESTALEFRAKFGQEEHIIFVPMIAIMAIYARENGRGMVFAEDEEEPPLPPDESKSAGSKRSSVGSHLKVVK